MDDDANLSVTPLNASEADDNDDLESLASFNFDAPATAAPEESYFEDYAAAPERSRMPQVIKELGIFINKKRRAATQGTSRGAATAWIDQDDSGTYDPKRKRATPSEYPPKKAKRQRLPEEFDEDGNPKPRRHQHPVGYGLLVTLSFKTEKALSYLRALTPGPVGSQSSNADDEISETSTDSDSGYGSFPKPRRKRKQPRRLGESSARVDGLTIDQLTVGHPQRRGCKACFEAGNDECTLIDFGFDYPCQACEDAEIDCELIIPLELKKSCERCKQKRRTCSYRDDGGRGVDACEACEEEGVTCCAGPLKESSYARRYDSSVSRPRQNQRSSGRALATPVQERMYVACNQCRDGSKRCSLKGKQSLGPCSCCRKLNEQCKFVLPTTRSHAVEDPIPFVRGKQRKTTTSRKSQTFESSTPPPPKRTGNPYSPNRQNSITLLTESAHMVSKQEERARKKGRSHLHSTSSRLQSTSGFDEESELIGYTLGQRHILKVTAFCHPIKFNYEPDPMGKEPCSWCESPFFGLYGLADEDGLREVEGFYWPDGAGFEEVMGGWSEKGFAPSKMCVSCTFERVRIVGCAMHILRPLSPANGEFDPQVWDDKAWYAAAEALKRNDDDGGKLILNAKWCSICPNLASFKCCARQAFDFNLGLGAADEEGCGLLLCAECGELVGKCVRAGFREGKTVVDRVVAEVGRNRLLYRNGVRADAEFLTSEGELMGRIMGEGCGGGGLGGEEGERADEVVDRKGKGKDMSFFEYPYNMPQQRGGDEKKANGKAMEVVSYGDAGGMQSKMTFGDKIEKDVMGRLRGGGGGRKQRPAFNFGEEVRASGKGKEKSRFLGDGGGMQGVEVIELSDGGE